MCIYIFVYIYIHIYTYIMCVYIYIHIYIHTHIYIHIYTYCIYVGFPGGSDSTESDCNAGGLGLIPGSGRSPGEEMATHSNTLV